VLWSVAANALVSSRARENSSSAEHTTAQFVRYRDDLEQVEEDLRAAITTWSNQPAAR
jgi:hypothetical protein